MERHRLACQWQNAGPLAHAWEAGGKVRVPVEQGKQGNSSLLSPICTEETHQFTRAEEEKNMTMHAEKTRRSGWLAVARIVGRLVLALVIFLGGYLLIFAVIYTVYVTLNYVVQLATVIPMTATAEEIRILNQTPHSLLRDADGLGYIFMSLATLFAVPVFAQQGLERWVKWFFLANGLMIPLVAATYFYPNYSLAVLLLSFPWGITLPGSMLVLAFFFSPLRKTKLVTMRA